MFWAVAVLLRAGIASRMARVLALLIHRSVALSVVSVTILTIIVASRVDLGKSLCCLAQFVSSCCLRSISVQNMSVRKTDASLFKEANKTQSIALSKRLEVHRMQNFYVELE